MDGRGRVAPTLKPKRPAAPRPAPVPPDRHKRLPPEPRPASRLSLLLRRLSVRLAASSLGRRGASMLTVAVIGGFSLYGTVIGGHVEEAKEIGLDIADAAANIAGFKVVQVNLSGQNHVTPAEILEAAGIKPSTSILFVHADETRARLEAMPWIQSASVRKFYPDRIDIAITERVPFALWQINREINVIGRDGRIIAPYSDDPRYINLPIVVGEGADRQVGEIVDVLARMPVIADQVRAAILVAERRWTLKMRNGIDVRLPEDGLEGALAQLADLDREKKLLSRDITIIDLRLPDRVAVRLSDAAADARAQMLKARAKARKGGAT
ncbi:cell division protein FtsQ/DivIB [Xanthobacter pseudotagetidis]|uniref:cell division protein FtsQ/DivIB n=1 Tax=Xanthobacter pseudotagetidis TaxID=3119911 RepID=UPI0037269B41